MAAHEKESNNIITETHHLEALRNAPTTDNVVVPRAVFEKLCANPNGGGSLRKKFGNPAPIALIGFLLAGMPLSCDLMGWRGTGGEKGALGPVFILTAGLVQVLAAIGEWILGNTFTCALFFTFGTFWLSLGAGLLPSFAIGAAYSPTGDSLEGQTTPAFLAATGFYYVAITILSVVFTVCSLRTNLCLFSALLLLDVAFGCFAGVYFELALGNAQLAERLRVVAGAFVFALCMIIWYIFIVQMLESVDFPFTLPLGDLSTYIRGKSEKLQRTQGVASECE
ncbi:hypothetical protein VTO42DRAFT_6174 [Malbranchea cinnamomea]